METVVNVFKRLFVLSSKDLMELVLISNKEIKMLKFSMNNFIFINDSI